MEELIARLDQRLAAVEGQLAVLVQAASLWMKQVTGMKEVRVTGYVRSRNEGGAILHLFTDHPLVLKRVGRVYEEHFAELRDIGIDPTKGKMFEGEGAPSRDWAIANGYFVTVKPFIAAFMPTGKQTDSGATIYRWHGIISATAPETNGHAAAAEATAASAPEPAEAAKKAAAAPEKAKPATKTTVSPADHPVWNSSQDAADWAVNQGAFMDAPAALEALTKLWRTKGQPAPAALFPIWEDHVRTMLREMEDA